MLGVFGELMRENIDTNIGDMARYLEKKST